MNRPRRPGARSVQLWGRGHQAGTGERLLAAQAPLLPPSPAGLAKQLAGALRPISKKARLLGGERREPGGWEVGCVCVYVFWGLGRKAFSAAAAFRAGGQHVREGQDGGAVGKGEKEVPGNRWPRQDWGFQTRGWERDGHLHLEAACDLPPPGSREKNWGSGRVTFIRSEVSPPTMPSPNTQRGCHQGEGSWCRGEQGKGEGCPHQPPPPPFSRTSMGDLRQR